MGNVKGWAKSGDEVALRSFGFGVIFLATLESLVLGGSALGWTCGREVVAVWVVLAALLGLWGARRLQPSRLERRRDHLFAKCLALIALVAWCVQFFRVAWLAWNRPVYDWDGLYYHLPALSGWVEAGRVTWLEGLADIPFANGYPMGSEVLGFVVHQLTGQSQWVDATTLLFWPLGLFALFLLCRQVGASEAWSWFAAGLSGQIPVFVALSTTTYVDATFAITGWVAVAAALRWSRLQSRASGWDALLLGAALGLCVGTKGLGWLLVILLLVWLIGSWFRSRMEAPQMVLQLSLGMAALLAVGGYWPARNIVHTGNPLHPIELRVGEKVLVEGYSPHAMVEQDLPPSWRAWPAVLRPVKSWVTFDSRRMGHNAVGGLGLLWIGWGLPSLVWLTIRRPRIPSWPPGLVLVALVFLVAQPGNWWSRFSLWLHAIGLPAAALATSVVGGSRLRRACEVAVVVIFVAAVVETEGALRWEQRQGRDPELGAYCSSFDYYFPRFTETVFAADFLSAEHIARSSWGRMGTLFGGALALPLGQRRLTRLDSPLDPSDLPRLRARGIGWVVWDVLHDGPLRPEVRAAARASYHYQAEPAIDFEFLEL